MDRNVISFNRPYMTGRELYYIADAHFKGRLAGDGPYTERCHQWLEKYSGCQRSLLTHSCTAALEMAAILLNLKQGDEVIMPSYTFVSTANAFVLRGAVPVFIDIRADTLNMDEELIEKAITPRTKAIVPVHYAGVSCEMDKILDLAKKHSLAVVEDAAQGIMSKYRGRPLGSIGDLGCYSFHETKNIISGEGGSLLINDPQLIVRAEIIREKGTDRSQFFRGDVDKYTWQDIGSSFLPGELIAAFLWAQLDEAERITRERIDSWNIFNELLEPLESKGDLRRPIVPEHCEHNAHMYYSLLPDEQKRNKIIESLSQNGIMAPFHYVPLHSSPAGKKYCKTSGSLDVTNSSAAKLIRLPLWNGLEEKDQMKVVDIIHSVL